MGEPFCKSKGLSALLKRWSGEGVCSGSARVVGDRRL